MSCSQSLELSFNNQDTKITDYAEKVKFTKCTLSTELGEDGKVSIVRIVPDNPEKEDSVAFSPTVSRQNGAVRMTIIKGQGEPLSETGTATIYYAGYVFTSGPSAMDFARGTFNGAQGTLFSYPASKFPTSSTTSGSSSGMTMFSTNHKPTALYVQWNVSDADYEPLNVSPSMDNIVEGLRNGLVGVQAGEVCDIAFSGKYGFGKKGMGTVPANAALLYRVWVESVSN